MIIKVINKIIHSFSKSEAFLKKAKIIIDQINQKESFFEKMEDIDLSNYTQVLKNKLKDGKTINDKEIIVDAFALVRESSKRILKMRHFDVQLIGGLALHYGWIAEMKTGEGKTLTSTLPAFLNALSGEPVHIVTVNDYLARRDSEVTAKLYNFLGMTVGCIFGGQKSKEKKEAYHCDITYGTNNEFGFDYLRDNMEISIKDLCQRGLGYAIIDECDSVLIDEARTPLIISGPAEDKGDLYDISNKIAQKVTGYEVDEKNHSAYLNDKGYDEVNDMLVQEGLIQEGENVFDSKYIHLLHHISQSLKAIHVFKINHNYIVRKGQVMIVDEFTGRVMEGRRYSDGLHQALEAKEGVEIHGENRTIASTTFQNYFRLYKKISGMTGTAYTEKEEFFQIYNLNICQIPTNMPICRIDEDDEIYATLEEKYEAMIKLIKERHLKQQPILVGTASIERSEVVSSLLKKEGIPHQVLNARYHEQEATIIAQAGVPSAITIATNMAGRGTDIKLGGNEEIIAKSNKISIEEAEKIIAQNKEIVIASGGLYVIATERHESRRIDNQLRGRSGRQGDVGRSKFFLSLEDDLMRIFGTDKAKNMLKAMGLKHGEAITHPWISRAIQKAQKKVEERNFEIRKSVLRYDDILNNHRKAIFHQRNLILNADNYEKIFVLIEQNYIKANQKILENVLKNKNYQNLFIDKVIFNKIKDDFNDLYNVETIELAEEYLEKNMIQGAQLLNFMNEKAKAILYNKFIDLNDDQDYTIEKRIWLAVIDELWREHLLKIDYLRQVINLRAFAQKDPFVEYAKEAFDLFSELRDEISHILIKKLVNLRVMHSNPFEEINE
jgi:preprotein translocase subunit SecA